MNQCIKAFLSCLILLPGLPLQAQFTYMPINSFTNYHLDQLDISGDLKNTVTSVKPIPRSDLYSRANSYEFKPSKRYFQIELFEYTGKLNSKSDKPDENANPWKGFKKSIYQTPAAFFSVKTPGLILMLNPVLGLSAGYDQSSGSVTNRFSEGFEVRGTIDSKVGFYSRLSINHFKFPDYFNSIIDSNLVIPGEGYHVRSEGSFEKFLKSAGYITFSPTSHIGMQLGFDRNFIGNGYRSLILSNFAREYPFLKINTKIWRLNYQNLFTQLIDYNKQSATGKGQQPKFMTSHYLGMKLFKNLDIGLFESVVFSRSDSTGSRGFDLNYLNPIIFYTAIERDLNSGDNVIVGFDWKWNFLQRFSFYGQLVLDEFSGKEMLKRSGWWGNKYGAQAGLKYINALGIKGLFLQAEYNLVRPYTYSHFNRSQNYVHYNEALAHPLQANFREIIFNLRYQLNYRWFIDGGFIVAERGLDSSATSKSFGGNILTTYLNRPYEYEHSIGQGVLTKYNIIWLNLSYMAYHNLWLDARVNLRSLKSDLSKYDSESSWVQLGLRMNVSMRNYDF
ncbi:MAG: hypothetical protein H6605_03850 [Flavobacteriales bacterium]|nr:hypothetical protein [Flavobacteriales bacterium]